MALYNVRTGEPMAESTLWRMACIGGNGFVRVLIGAANTTAVTTASMLAELDKPKALPKAKK